MWDTSATELNEWRISQSHTSVIFRAPASASLIYAKRVWSFRSDTICVIKFVKSDSSTVNVDECITEFLHLRT